ncbi:acyl-CoA dehydrogenase family protein [Dietzia lutea]|uniref:Acyl-CoA dehydrogenase n=1 Tax=Dietzia lutea TaxID=546160 RepID=A0A2S1R905_9ACTN|nr:acyl-CoA dehydrogenase family protein [Dietzia lutea]AWH92770.1 hypothetical protein A6035_11980 [Dietzia lutea]
MLLSTENSVLDHYAPGLREKLQATGLVANEGPDSTAIRDWAGSGGTGLIVPAELGGRGATAVEAVRFQTAVGALAPSLGAATTMHHLSCATLFEAAEDASDDERALIRDLVEQGTVMASGFSEGKPGGSVFRPTMTARRDGDDYLLSGRKAPCSLARSMSLLVASALVDQHERAVVLVFNGSDGLSREEFWKAPVLAAAESDALVLDEVRVKGDMVFLMSENDPDNVHEMTGYLWFGLLISACYLGVATGMVETLARRDPVDAKLLTSALAEVEAMRTSLLAVAREFDDGARGGDVSARLALVRWSMRDALVRVQSRVREGVGGFAYMQDPALAYAFEAAQVFSYHPPSRRETSHKLVAWARGEDFRYA